MQLEFKKQGGLYEVEFEVTGNFNLHLERKNYGRIEIYQKTSSETNYASSPSYSANGDAIINFDFTMGIYPKYVKILSYSEPLKGIVTMEGASGSSDGLRPVTAGDILLKIATMQDEYEVDFQNPIEVPANTTLSFKFLKQGGYISQTLFDYQIVTEGDANDSWFVFPNSSSDRVIHLDLYVK